MPLFSNPSKTNRAYCIIVFLLFSSFSHIYSQQLQADFVMDKTGGCSPLTIAFTNTTRGASAGATYSWDLGNDNKSILKDPGAVYNDEKTYTVTLTVTDGTKTSSTSKTVTVYKKPTADFTVNAPKVCMPAAAVFTASTNAGDGYISSYRWDFGDGVTTYTGTNQAARNYSYVQKATVTLSVTNNYGCYNSVTKKDIVEILPALQPEFNIQKDVLCEVTDVASFTNTSSGGGPSALSYKWDFGDGQASTTKTPTHVYNKKGLYTVQLTVSNADGCSVTTSRGPLNVAFFNTNFNSSMLCREVRFTDATNYTVYPTASLWKFDDNTISNSMYGVAHTYATEGTYKVKLINTYAGICLDSVEKTIVVKDKVNYNSDFSTSLPLCRDNNVSFTPSSSVQPSSFVWEFGHNGAGNSWYTHPSYVYPAAGNYTVTLTNTFGTCTEKITKVIKVNELPALTMFDTKLSSPCGAPSSVQFKDKTSDAVSWNWTMYHHDYWYNYTNYNVKEPSHNYPNDGDYQVDLTVRNAAGCQASTSKIVTVRRPSVYAYIVSQEFPGGINNCGDVKAKFAANGSEEITEYKWSFSDGTTSAEKEPERLFTKPGNYNVQLQYKTINGCTGTVGAGSVTVYYKPKANFTFSVPACSDRVVVTLRDQSDVATGWQWDFGAGSGNNGSYSPEVSYPDTGKYMVQLTTYYGGCSDVVTKEIYASTVPAFIRITSANWQGCDEPRGTYTFNQTSLRATGNVWNFGDGSPTVPYDTSNHNVKHVYTKTGIYTVSISATFGSCALSHSTQVIAFMKQKPMLSADRTTFCNNEAINVRISNLEYNPHSRVERWYENDHYSIYKYIYEEGNNVYSDFTGNVGNYFNFNAYSSSMSGFRTGNIKIRAIVRSNYTGCLDTSNAIALQVNGPEAGFIIITNDVCFKSPLVFQDDSKRPTSTAIEKWTWNFGDGTPNITNTTNAIVRHTYSNPGNYNVSLTVTDKTGCTSTISSYPDYARVKGPKVDFTPSGLYVPIVPLSTTVTFYNNTNTANNNTVDYVWDYGQNTTGSTDYTGSYKYDVAGSYTVKLTAKDPASGCTDFMTKQIQVKDFNTAYTFSTAFIGGNNCPPVVLNINNLSVGYIRLLWDFGDGTQSEDQPYPTHIYTKPGKYVITLRTYGYNGLTGIYKDSIYVEQPSIQPLAADVWKRCLNQPVKLSSNIDNTLTYTWDFGDGTIKQNDGSAPTHNFATAGFYTPTLMVTDSRGCSVATTVPDKIEVRADPTVTITPNDPLICLGKSVQLTATVYGGDIYNWSPTTNLSSTNTASVIATPTTSSTYKLDVTDDIGCKGSGRVNIEVVQPQKIKLAPTASVCDGESITLKASGTDLYNWINNTSGLSNTQVAEPTAIPTANITYTVEGSDIHKCFTDRASIDVTVLPLPKVDAGPGAEIMPGTEIQLNGTGSSDIIRWTWSPRDYLNCVNCPSPISKPKAEILYTLTAKSSNGCDASDTVRLKMICNESKVAIPNAFSPNGDGNNDLFSIKGISILKHLIIFDRWGFKVFERKNTIAGDRYSAWDGTLNGNPLPTGSYIYYVEMECPTGKFLKKGTVVLMR